MIALNLLIGCTGLFLAGSSMTRFEQTKELHWLLISLGEIVTGVYFVIAAVGV